jgi:hypothetical protein
MKFLERIIALIQEKSTSFDVTSIDCKNEGATIYTSTGETILVCWADLVEAIGIRRSAYTTDNISLLLIFQSAGSFEILSSCNGWLDLCSKIEQQRQGFPFNQWHAKILDANSPSAIIVFNRDCT